MHTKAATEGGLRAGATFPVGGVVINQIGQRTAVNQTLENVPQNSMEQGFKGFVQRSQIGSASQLLAGGVAGVVSKTCTAPLARLTILFQVQGMHLTTSSALARPTIMQEASRIIFEEGIRAFWKGNGVTIIHRLPYSSISFFAYEKYKTVLLRMASVQSRQDSLGIGMGSRLAAGGAAGITAASLTYPLDLVRTRLAAQTNAMYYRGIMHALATIYRDEGLVGLYKGMGTTLLGVGPNIAINFCAYETLRSVWTLRRPDTSGAWVSLVCGSVAGIASSTATFPLDLVRRRMQLEGAAGKARIYQRGLVGTFRQIVHCEGWLGLYRGMLPEYVKVIPSVGIVFMSYEFMKSCLSQSS